MCADAPGRLFPIAHISLADVDLAVTELERAVKAGCKGAMMAPYTWTRKAHGHPYYDPLWAKAQELDVPLALHPSFEPIRFSQFQRFDELKTQAPIEFSFNFDVLVVQAMQQAFVSLFNYGMFERFPKAKAVVLESQAGWIGNLLDRMDAVWEGPLQASTALKHPPRFYFDRQCWISCDPDERAVAHIIESVGADKFFWASDFPHPDHNGRLYGASEGSRSAVVREDAAQSALRERAARLQARLSGMHPRRSAARPIVAAMMIVLATGCAPEPPGARARALCRRRAVPVQRPARRGRCARSGEDRSGTALLRADSRELRPVARASVARGLFPEPVRARSLRNASPV